VRLNTVERHQFISSSVAGLEGSWVSRWNDLGRGDWGQVVRPLRLMPG
jgi:hypothetical protein